LAVSAPAKQGYGSLSGVVLDPSGMPQMGASVWLISEDASGKIITQLLSNQDGGFTTDHLKPGKYAVRVSLAGFLPTIERHIAVMADLTTLLRVQVDSLFSSLDTLRRKSDAPVETDTGSGCCALPRQPVRSCSGAATRTPVCRSAQWVAISRRPSIREA